MRDNARPRPPGGSAGITRCEDEARLAERARHQNKQSAQKSIDPATAGSQETMTSAVVPQGVIFVPALLIYSTLWRGVGNNENIRVHEEQ